jgi:uncharacterized membrane protein
LDIIGFKGGMEAIGSCIDGAGVGVMVIGVVAATIWFFVRLRSLGIVEAYTRYRRAVGRAILLGLELLVAGDIIRTVAVSPTLTSVAVLGVIVVIRTFLSMSLQLELEGRWPWQRDVQPRSQ